MQHSSSAMLPFSVMSMLGGQKFVTVVVLDLEFFPGYYFDWMASEQGLDFCEVINKMQSYWPILC